MANLKLDVSASISGSVAGGNDLALVTAALSKSKTIKLKSGAGAGQAEKLFADNRTLAASATESLDLAGGALEDVFGNALTFTKIKAIEIIAAEGNTNDVIVGGAAANAWLGFFGDVTDKVKIPPGGVFAIASNAGWDVVAGTGDLLKIANSAAGSSVSFDIVLAGL